MAVMTLESILTGAGKRWPPWTTRCAIASGGVGSLARNPLSTCCGTSLSPLRWSCEICVTAPGPRASNAASLTDVLPLFTVTTVQDRSECFVLHTVIPVEHPQWTRDAMSAASQTHSEPLSAADLKRIHAWWRAANYLAAGQIYLLDNPLLREPLTLEHIKPRLLGHWGTTPGINFVYAHLNRIIIARDRDVLAIIGPGHGGPALVANTYLEGSYSEMYPDIGRDVDGMQRLFKQFSFPGGIPSHCAPDVPGSINEGGELGYSLSHAFGAAFDNPSLLVACIIGDGEAESGPLATAWHSNKFLNPARDGAVLPILHLNGYKIAGPTVLARLPHDELESLFRGYGYRPFFVEGSEPESMHRLMAATLDHVVTEIKAIQHAAPTG